MSCCRCLTCVLPMTSSTINLLAAIVNFCCHQKPFMCSYFYQLHWLHRIGWLHWLHLLHWLHQLHQLPLVTSVSSVTLVTTVTSVTSVTTVTLVTSVIFVTSVAIGYIGSKLIGFLMNLKLKFLK